MKDNVPAKVVAMEYDPNRSARIALIQYADGVKSYIVAPSDLKIGSTVVSGERVDIVSGNCLPLTNIPVGTIVHNIELKAGKGAEIARSAGSAAQILAKEGKYAQIKLPSNEVRFIDINCRACIGQVGNTDHGIIKSWQSRKKQMAWCQAKCKRNSNEPARSSTWWWRR